MKKLEDCRKRLINKKVSKNRQNNNKKKYNINLVIYNKAQIIQIIK